MARMVCCMYYTDVFVGQDNIDNLNKALKAELSDFNDSIDLTQLVQGLCLFLGYPSCVCKPKKSVGESLEKISEELKKELKNYKCLSKSISNSDLNCDSCSNSDVVCKCCVLDCISKVQKSSCECVNGSNKNCSCSNDGTQRCCKDLLEKLKASLSLLNLKADMAEICSCNDEKCCDKGECTKVDSSNCDHCKNLKTSKTPNDYTVTGLGLLRPSPKRLAERLEGFFGSGPKSSSGCTCNGSPCTCCCLACDKNQCVQACSCVSKISCKKPLECPRQTFCLAINSIKVPSKSSDMKCCQEGTKCHCQVDTPKCSGSPNCCDQKKKVKCLIRRLVSYFKSLEISSVPEIKNFKNCCEFLCVLKTCEFLWKFYGKRNAKECKTCKRGTSGCSGSSGKCCNGTISGCTDPDCCKDCPDCGAVKFSKALETLRFAGPCGQELWRVLDDFLNFICYVFYPRVKLLEKLIKAARDSCSQCKTGHSSCSGCKSGTSGSPSCQGCAQVLTLLKTHKDILSLMTRGYVSSYDPSSAKWNLLCSPSPPKCCCGQDSCSCSKSSSPSLCCKSSSSCDPSKCCPDCPQRKAAKIFLGILPCLYYGLKIVYDRCQYGSGFAGWNLAKIPEASGLKDFLSAWGFTSSTLSSKYASGLPVILEYLYGSGKFKSLFDLVSKKYFSRYLSDASLSPSTVRQMLLWLYGLRFQKHFSDLVSHCSSLCSPFGNSYNSDAFCYYIHTCCFILPVSVISVIQCPDGSPSFLPSPSDWQNFCYPDDLSSLFEKLCEYARKIFVALNFLYYQCERVGSQAGWAYCWYGQKCLLPQGSSNSLSTSSSGSCSSCPNSGAYLCTTTKSDNPVHDHCREGKCLGSGSCDNSSSVHKSKPGSCKNPCPHPLMRFLIDDSSDSDSKSPFKLPSDSYVPPMGFSQENLPSPGKSGNSLYYVLKSFCKDGFCPLTRLVQFILCVSQRPPETLLDLYAFFKQFVEALNSKPDLSSTFVDWINGEPGSYPGRFFAATVQAFYGAKDSHWKNGDQKKGHKNSDKTPADLQSLYNCHPKKESNVTCGPYLHPLTDNVAGVFTPELCSMYLSWICYQGPRFHSEFQKFHKEAEKKFSCCKSSCEKIVECPCALPFIYSHGFTFHSPSTLNCVDGNGNSR
ncbi:variant erythrocyte surface antigen-1 family protein, partial [Babesia divergens]